MNLFLIGAGASRGTFDSRNFRVPTTNEFGEVLSELDAEWKSSFRTLGLAVRCLGLDDSNWSLADVWTLIDYHAKLADALPFRTADWSGSSIDMKKALLTVYGQRCDLKAEEVAEDSTLYSLFERELNPGDVVVSFNYDTIAERIIRRVGRDLCPTRRCDGEVTLVKPHGSASWPIPQGLTLSEREPSLMFDSLTVRDVDGGRQPLMLGVVPIKSELIREVQLAQGAPAVFDVISREWREVVRAISECDRVIAVGYSFPQDDTHGRFLLREGLRVRTSETRPTIDFFEVDGKRVDVERSIHAVFETDHGVSYRGAVLPTGAR
jgi:hypothetical protein